MNRSVLAGLLLLFPAGRQGSPGKSLVECLSRKPVARWVLPRSLREVSGLAITEDGRLLAHNDEMAMVAELDRKTGRVIKSFRLGQTLTPGDFEAIAMVGPRLFLVTSAGILYEAREGRDGSAVPFTRTPTGASGLCEVEGMSYDPAAQALLLLCKTVTRKKLRGGVLVLRWSLEQNRWLTPDRISVPLDAAFLQGFPGEFRGSDLARDPRTGHYLAVAGINRVVVEFSVEGRLIGQGPLGKHHPQAEGVAIGSDGTIYISDEGAKSPGTVAVYACAK